MNEIAAPQAHLAPTASRRLWTFTTVPLADRTSGHPATEGNRAEPYRAVDALMLAGRNPSQRPELRIHLPDRAREQPSPCGSPALTFSSPSAERVRRPPRPRDDRTPLGLGRHELLSRLLEQRLQRVVQVRRS